MVKYVAKGIWFGFMHVKFDFYTFWNRNHLQFSVNNEDDDFNIDIAS